MRGHVLRTIGLLLILCVASTSTAAGQTPALNAYLDSQPMRTDAAAVASMSPADRTVLAIRDLMPLNRSGSFSRFVQAKLSKNFLNIESLRLNKMVAGAPGVAGTALVSRVAAPAVLGAAIEYGGILQQTSGTVTTLRANALGLGRLLLGGERFMY